MTSQSQSDAVKKEHKTKKVRDWSSRTYTLRRMIGFNETLNQRTHRE
jgi:hypothetical protein